MERAFYVSDPKYLRQFKLESFQRIYFGNEFCEFLLPTPKQLEWVIRLTQKMSLKLTLTTPYANPLALRKVERLLEILPDQSEVIFNDWGVFRKIPSRLIPVHGRLLFTIKKDPRIKFQNIFNSYFRSHNLKSEYQDLLLTNKINRVELDNVIQGFDLTLKPEIHSSMYLQYIPISITRKCLFANKGLSEHRPMVVKKCHYECLQEKIETHIDGSAITIEGKVQYYQNSDLPPFQPSWNLDRLILSPVFPLRNSKSMVDKKTLTNTNSGISDTNLLSIEAF